MRKYNQIHIKGAPHYKTHFRYLRNLEDFKCALWPEKYGNFNFLVCRLLQFAYAMCAIEQRML